MLTIARQERLLLLPVLGAILAMLFEHQLVEAGRLVALLAAGGLIVLIVIASMRVAHQAEVLAVKVGDPYGTMILTLSAVLVEVIILAI